jgi:hypothetical protein
MSAPLSFAEALNQSCDCITLDEAQLDRSLRRESESFGVAELAVSHPHLLSRSALFVTADTLAAMREVVSAVERVVALSGYVEASLKDAHPHARIDQGTLGALLGYDFHLAEAGPQLIEINTNPGGGLLNALLRRAQRACCEPIARAFQVQTPELNEFFAVFLEEWRRARGEQPLVRIAIVDEAPKEQFLYPEFVLFARMSQAHGVRAVICDARELSYQGGKLTAQGEKVDLVYNRLTDFTLTDPAHAALLQAYLDGAAVVTPHPRAHALYADKQRLALLSDPQALVALGAAPEDAALLSRHVPTTVVVTPELREQLWSDRKGLFFKPQSGYGSKAAYRGDKLTKTVFEQVLRGPYVAQRLVPPSARRLSTHGEPRDLKADVRNFAYAGRVHLVCARLYQGQTTNFRTSGGGFAPVYETPP